MPTIPIITGFGEGPWDVRVSGGILDEQLDALLVVERLFGKVIVGKRLWN